MHQKHGTFVEERGHILNIRFSTDQMPLVLKKFTGIKKISLSLILLFHRRISTLVYLRRPKYHVFVMIVELAGLSTLFYYISK